MLIHKYKFINNFVYKFDEFNLDIIFSFRVNIFLIVMVNAILISKLCPNKLFNQTSNLN